MVYRCRADVEGRQICGGRSFPLAAPHPPDPTEAGLLPREGRAPARALGAVAIKNSVYVLPLNEQTQEDLQWISREIVQEGGEATLCKASFVEGLRDEQVEALFQAARDADYAQIAEEARELAGEIAEEASRR